MLVLPIYILYIRLSIDATIPTNSAALSVQHIIQLFYYWILWTKCFSSVCSSMNLRRRQKQKLKQKIHFNCTTEALLSFWVIKQSGGKTLFFVLVLFSPALQGLYWNDAKQLVLLQLSEELLDKYVMCDEQWVFTYLIHGVFGYHIEAAHEPVGVHKDDAKRPERNNCENADERVNPNGCTSDF